MARPGLLLSPTVKVGKASEHFVHSLSRGIILEGIPSLKARRGGDIEHDGGTNGVHVSGQNEENVQVEETVCKASDRKQKECSKNGGY